MEANQLNLNIPSPLSKLEHNVFAKHNVTVFIKRDDAIHSEISGNKWRKLKLNVQKYHAGKYEAILSFGGAYSNHIRALAAVGKNLNIPTIGVVRGEELNADSNQTLKNASLDGMQLEFVSREEYSWRYEMDYKQQLRNRFGNVLVVEEGGANFHGVMGCTEIVSEINLQPDYFILPSGTGTTAAGILFASESEVISIPVFKNGDFIRTEIQNLLYYSGLGDDDIDEMLDRLTLGTDFHFGGYGKFNTELIAFMNAFYEETGIQTDQIYTGKMFYGLCELIKSGKIKNGSTVVAIHTGGLQGTSSIADQLVY